MAVIGLAKLKACSIHPDTPWVNMSCLNPHYVEKINPGSLIYLSLLEKKISIWPFIFQIHCKKTYRLPPSGVTQFILSMRPFSVDSLWLTAKANLLVELGQRATIESYYLILHIYSMFTLILRDILEPRKCYKQKEDSSITIDFAPYLFYVKASLQKIFSSFIRVNISLLTENGGEQNHYKIRLKKINYDE